jgi:iron complex outermembrane receptor protein
MATQSACAAPGLLAGAFMLSILAFTVNAGEVRAETGTEIETRTDTGQNLRDVSIEDLARISVTSVSKTDEPIGDAPAAIYVITHDDIRRSGAPTLPEMLRLAPNLQVYEQGPGQWVVTGRGMNGNPGAQSFSNKLLVLIDGRSIYTPLYSGVYWDLPDILPADIDRIEVISGPGATLWGANAVNGVVNIITRSAEKTQGLQLDLRAGTARQALGAQIGGRAGETIAWRASLRWLHEDSGLSSSDASTNDPFQRLGGNVRIDWTPSPVDTVTLTGEGSDGRLGQDQLAHEDTRTRNLSLDWQRQTGNGGALQVLAYYDRVERDSVPAGGRFYTSTWDLDAQDTLSVGGRHRVVWGLGARLTHYGITGTDSLFFTPAVGDLNLANIFVQDTFDITGALKLTAGLKLEKDPYAAASILPEVRLAWKPVAGTMIWAALSGAVRSPTPFDRDVQERAGTVSLMGDKSFRTEKLTAYELGLRTQPTRTISISATGFYNDYSRLRSIELLPGPGLNLTWGNNLYGHSYGLDSWFDWRPVRWWTITGGASLLTERFKFAPGASGLLGTAQLGSDPSQQFRLRSSLNLPAQIEFDATLRAVASLPSPYVPAYRELDVRIARPFSRRVNLELTGTNLLHAQHVEYPGAAFIPRRVMAGLAVAL